MSTHGRTRLLQWIALAMILGGPIAGIPCYLTQAQQRVPAGFSVLGLVLMVPAILPPLGCVVLAIVGPGILVRVLALFPFVIVGAAFGFATVPLATLTASPFPDSGPVFEILLVLGAFVLAWLWAVSTTVLALLRSRKSAGPTERHPRNGHSDVGSPAHGDSISGAGCHGTSIPS